MTFVFKSIQPLLNLFRYGRTTTKIPSQINALAFDSNVRPMSTAVRQQFEEAKKKLDTLKEDPGNVTKLKLYALYKQATVGKCNAPKPSMVDFVGKAKWDAWNSLGDMSSEEAQKQYVNVINDLVGNSDVDIAAQPTAAGQFETLLYSKSNGVGSIVLNRPKKKNALSIKMYEEIVQVLREATTDDSISFVTFAGAGDFYCSGNDLSNFASSSTGDLPADAKKMSLFLENYINSYIDFPKPIVGIINGPAVGVAVTVLGLFDLVYASDRATFHTPFSALGQSPEGCSSYTFPMLMGPAKANELLMLGRKITAVEACERGLVSEVFPDHSFQKEVASRITNMSKLPARSVLYAKQIFRNSQKDFLRKINSEECVNLAERWQSQDCMDAIMSFLKKSSKL